MEYSRRRLLQTMGLAVAAARLAGCNGRSSDETTTAAETDSETETAVEATTEDAESSMSVDVAIAVVAEWSAIRARLYDTVVLAAVGRLGTVARVTGDVFARFERPSGERGAHEQLGATDKQNYETSESHLGGAREAYVVGDAERGPDLAVQAAGNLFAAQCGRVDAVVVDALEVLLLGARTRDADLLTAAGEADATAELADVVYEDFEDVPAHSLLESASGELYETFGVAAEGVADAGDAETIAALTRTAADATVGVSYEFAPEAAAGASHLALMQVVGLDAEVLARLGGPGDKFVRVAALSPYRARVADVPWLVAASEADFAATVVSDVFTHFEGVWAHETLRGADHDTYEGSEGGLESLTEVVESGDGTAAEEAVATMDENLLTGISALVGGEVVAVFEAAFFRARLDDARELVAVGETDRAAAVGGSPFARFEESETNLHEPVEEEPEELYHRSEEEYLAGLVEDAVAGNADAAAAHAKGAMDALFEFEAAVGATAEMSAAEVAFFGARGFDTIALAQVGVSARAGSVVQSTFAFSESGAGGYHEILEEVDHDLYELFRGTFDSVRAAAEEGGGAYGTIETCGQKAAGSMYAVVTTATVNADLGAATSERIVGVFQMFEEVHIHKALEGADRDAYESFEAALSDYVDVLTDGNEVDAAAEAYATTAARAQFAVVGEVGKAPEASSSEDDDSVDMALLGGSNVVEGVPEDADHVVEMSAVAFGPAELTVSAGDTVVLGRVGGEAHSVTAYGDELPEGVAYWASGGFESREVAETGWSEGKGAVQSGQSYVHAFETAGEHAYYCVPHEAAGMTGIIVVEEWNQLPSRPVCPGATSTR